MGRMWILAGTLMAGLLMWGASGCTRPLKDQVVGKWKHSNSAAQLEFLKDGTVIYALGPLHATGTYATPDEKHIRTEFKGLPAAMLGSQTYEAGVREKQLTLRVGTEPLSFTRVE